MSDMYCNLHQINYRCNIYALLFSPTNTQQIVDGAFYEAFFDKKREDFDYTLDII